MTDKTRGEGPKADAFGEIRLGLDGLLNALGAAISEVSNRLDDHQTGEIRRSFEIDTGKGPVRAEAGVRMRFADAGPPGAGRAGARMTRPVNAAPGHSRPADPPPAPPERPIAFDTVEDAGTWRLTADVPGVAEPEIALSMEEGELVIETTGARRFRGRTPLPEGTGLDDLEMSLRNGILELSCRRPDGPAS